MPFLCARLQGSHLTSSRSQSPKSILQGPRSFCPWHFWPHLTTYGRDHSIAACSTSRTPGPLLPRDFEFYSWLNLESIFPRFPCDSLPHSSMSLLWCHLISKAFLKSLIEDGDPQPPLPPLYFTPSSVHHISCYLSIYMFSWLPQCWEVSSTKQGPFVRLVSRTLWNRRCSINTCWLKLLHFGQI